MPKNFSQKGMTGNFLQFMKDLEKNKLCCLDFLTGIFTEDSSSIAFGGDGTKANPLTAVSKISGNIGNIITIVSDGLYVSGSPSLITTEATNFILDLAIHTYIYTGAIPGSWTMPPLAGNINKEYMIKNASTHTLTLNPQGSDTFYDTASITPLILLPGDSYTFVDDGAFWQIF